MNAIRKWWRERQIRKELDRIDCEHTKAVLEAVWYNGKPVVGTVDDDGVLHLEIIQPIAGEGGRER